MEVKKMYNNIQKEKEIIASINSNLRELKMFLIGNPTEDTISNSDCKEPNCLQDEIIYNLNSLYYALGQIITISKAIRGDK